MEGYVYYVPIGGVNLMSDEDTGITGSSNGSETGVGFYVNWSLPGGITKNEWNSWGYILEAGVESYDEDIYKYLGDVDPNSSEATNIINGLITKYIDRLFTLSGVDPDVSFDRFNKEFRSCIR